MVRAAVQWMLLSPITFVVKPPPPPGVRTVVGTIAVAVGCVLWHVWADSPSAGEETEGYLHGGVVIDFVGQSGFCGSEDVERADVMQRGQLQRFDWC